MSKRNALVLSLACLVAAAVFSQGINWRPDVTAAMSEARRTGKIVMIDVYTDWCGWCKRMDRDTYANPRAHLPTAGF